MVPGQGVTAAPIMVDGLDCNAKIFNYVSLSQSLKIRIMKEWCALCFRLLIPNNLIQLYVLEYLSNQKNYRNHITLKFISLFFTLCCYSKYDGFWKCKKVKVVSKRYIKSCNEIFLKLFLYSSLLIFEYEVLEILLFFI